eukprot:4211622-Karenia_brevis.AAC.1
MQMEKKEHMQTQAFLHWQWEIHFRTVLQGQPAPKADTASQLLSDVQATCTNKSVTAPGLENDLQTFSTGNDRMAESL